MIHKQILLPDRVRRPPAEGWSWIDRRFLREHASRLSHNAILLYFFLVAVSDKHGLSFYGDATIAGVSGLGYKTTSEFDRDVTSPMWIAGGVAFKPIENLTITADAQYTNWGKLDELDTEFKDNAWKAFMGQSGGDKISLQWEDKTQLRFGIEYVLNKIALRGGYYYDPAPAPDKTFTILIPQYDYNVLTLGLGYAGNGFAINGGFEYLMATDREVEFYPSGSTWGTAENMAGTHGMKILTFILGVSYGW